MLIPAVSFIGEHNREIHQISELIQPMVASTGAIQAWPAQTETLPSQASAWSPRAKKKKKKRERNKERNKYSTTCSIVTMF